jgi:hypothetical protein
MMAPLSKRLIGYSTNPRSPEPPVKCQTDFDCQSHSSLLHSRRRTVPSARQSHTLRTTDFQNRPSEVQIFRRLSRQQPRLATLFSMCSRLRQDTYVYEVLTVSRLNRSRSSFPYSSSRLLRTLPTNATVCFTDHLKCPNARTASLKLKALWRLHYPKKHWHTVCFTAIVSHSCCNSKPPLCAQPRAAKGRRNASRQVALFFTFFCVSSYTLAQENTFHAGSLGLAPLLMVYGVAPLRIPAKPTAIAPELSLDATSEFTGDEERQFGALFKPRGSESEAFVLLRKKIPSRYAYESWAKVKPGFGQFFPDDVVARSRTSGVGIQDPEWVYIKMSLRF